MAPVGDGVETDSDGARLVAQLFPGDHIFEVMSYVEKRMAQLPCMDGLDCQGPARCNLDSTAPRGRSVTPENANAPACATRPVDAAGAEDNHLIAAPIARLGAVVALRALNNCARCAWHLQGAVVHRATGPTAVRRVSVLIEEDLHAGLAQQAAAAACAAPHRDAIRTYNGQSTRARHRPSSMSSLQRGPVGHLASCPPLALRYLWRIVAFQPIANVDRSFT
jgi:hypothetical protein